MRSTMLAAVFALIVFPSLAVGQNVERSRCWRQGYQIVCETEKMDTPPAGYMGNEKWCLSDPDGILGSGAFCTYRRKGECEQARVFSPRGRCLKNPDFEDE